MFVGLVKQIDLNYHPSEKGAVESETIQLRLKWGGRPAPSQLIQWWGWQALVAGFLFRTFPQWLQVVWFLKSDNFQVG